MVIVDIDYRVGAIALSFAMKKKIVIIDFWTKAVSSQIMPIYDHLDKDKFEFLLVHFASIVGNDEEKFKTVGQIACYDYWSFSKFSIKKLFRKIQPDLVIILNHCDLMDRAVLKVGKKLGVPVLFIQHGFFDTHLGEQGYKEFIGNKYGLTRYFEKFKKYTYFFINYLLASQFLDRLYIFKKEFYMIMFNALTNPVRFLYYLHASEDARPDLSFVYGLKDKELSMDTYGYSESSIITGGSILFERYLDIAGKFWWKKCKEDLGTKPDASN